MKILYDHISDISDTAWDSIVENFLNDLKMIPSAFPTVGQIKSSWYAHKRAHPAPLHYDHAHCDHCRGSGIGYIIDKDDNGQITKRMAFCRHCDNWKRQFGADAIKQVSRDGVMIDTTRRDYPGEQFFIPFVSPDPLFRVGVMKRRYVGDLVSGIGKGDLREY